MPKKTARRIPQGKTVVKCPGMSCPHVEINWDSGEAVIIDDLGGVAKFTSLSQLWDLATRISVALCDGQAKPNA